MSFSEVWSDAFETTPAGTHSVSTGDDRIRELKLDIRERMEVEHHFSTHGGGTDTGRHRLGECSVVYTGVTADIEALSDISGGVAFDTTLLQWKTNNGSSWTVRSPIPTGNTFKVPVYSNTALAGWTLVTTLDDKVLMVTKGSVAGGAAGGAALSGSTWTQPTHTHTGPSHAHTGPSHAHGPGTLGGTTDGPVTPTGRKDGSDADIMTEHHKHNFDVTTGATASGGTGNTGAAGTGATSAGATANTWRPAAYCFTVQSKD